VVNQGSQIQLVFLTGDREQEGIGEKKAASEHRGICKRPKRRFETSVYKVGHRAGVDWGAYDCFGLAVVWDRNMWGEWSRRGRPVRNGPVKRHPVSELGGVQGKDT